MPAIEICRYRRLGDLLRSISKACWRCIAGCVRRQLRAGDDQQIQKRRGSVVAISLRQDAAGEKNKMNPTMANEETGL